VVFPDIIIPSSPLRGGSRWGLIRFGTILILLDSPPSPLKGGGEKTGVLEKLLCRHSGEGQVQVGQGEENIQNFSNYIYLCLKMCYIYIYA
jgi:hypothetical protein